VAILIARKVGIAAIARMEDSGWMIEPSVRMGIAVCGLLEDGHQAHPKKRDEKLHAAKSDSMEKQQEDSRLHNGYADQLPGR
jgi:hypothetical protein